MGLHCIKKHVLSTNFHWQQKRGVKNFYDGKKIWKTRGQKYSSSYFVSVCVAVFLTSIFLFQNAFYYFIGKIFFNRSSPIEEYLSHGNFRNCLSTKREFEQVAVSLYEVSKIFKGIQKTMPFKLNAIFT